MLLERGKGFGLALAYMESYNLTRKICYDFFIFLLMNCVVLSRYLTNLILTLQVTTIEAKTGKTFEEYKIILMCSDL